jgi:hypothetical protein
MKTGKTILLLVVLCLVATLTLAQQPAAQQPGQAGAGGQRGGGGGGRGQQQLTPEQQVAREIAQARLQRPMDTLDTVWLEEMTVTEVRDAITAGKTMALVLTGGVEANGPHLAQGKHNYILRVMGDSIARRLGNTLIAPIVTLEPSGGVTGEPQIGRAGPQITQATYLALLTDIGDSLRSMGFKKVLYLGDSGSNRAGMMNAANALNAKYKGEQAQFYHIPEYYDYRTIQEYIQNTLKIPEQINLGGSNGWADGIHEEYGIDALMALHDPTTIRFEERVKAGRAVINGVPLEPLSRLLDHGQQFRELRTQYTIAGIYKALAAAPPVYGQTGQE